MPPFPIASNVKLINAKGLKDKFVNLDLARKCKTQTLSCKWESHFLETFESAFLSKIVAGVFHLFCIHSVDARFLWKLHLLVNVVRSPLLSYSLLDCTTLPHFPTPPALVAVASHQWHANSILSDFGLGSMTANRRLRLVSDQVFMKCQNNSNSSWRTLTKFFDNGHW